MDERAVVRFDVLPHRTLTSRHAFGGALLFAYGWWAASLRPFSGAATAAILGSGVVAIVFGLRSRRPSQPVQRRGVGVWAVLTLALAGLQLAAYLQHPRSQHPTLSVVVNAALEPHPMRAASFVAWFALGVWAAAR